MSLFQTATVLEVVKLIHYSHKINELGEGNADYEAAGYQVGMILETLVSHYEDTDFPFGSGEDIDMAMSICYHDGAIKWSVEGGPFRY